ncbi:unnamed protein product [Dibothriocephalus latus]|uniref:BTB domain-containing protein n=1 Tax=Dibothriocephalus latus TaxID=60516 RepID=A0A3P7LGT7_DIBLA|nr:unnamed protein product [Dibothriocephalus latus]
MSTFQSAESKPFAFLERYRKQGGLCDFTFFVNGVYFRAHKVVLAATIPFFRDVFLQGGQCAEFDQLLQFSPELLETIISFAYNGWIEVTEANLCKLLDAAKKLQMGSLSMRCAEYISTQ